MIMVLGSGIGTRSKPRNRLLDKTELSKQPVVLIFLNVDAFLCKIYRC